MSSLKIGFGMATAILSRVIQTFLSSGVYCLRRIAIRSVSGRIKMKRRLPAVACLMLSVLISPGIYAQAQWKVANTFHIGDDGGWDYVTVDSQTHRLYVTRSTHTQIINGDSGKVLGDVPGQERSHGVAIAPKLNRGFITDGGGSGSIVVFDLTSYAVLGKIPTVPDPTGSSTTRSWTESWQCPAMAGS